MHQIANALLISMCLALRCPSLALADTERVVTWVNGRHTLAPPAEMPWMAASAKLPLAGPLLIDGQPVRSIRDPGQSPSSPAGPFIEFFGGDLLPAKVVVYEKTADGARSYLLVEPLLGGRDSPDKQPSIRVSTAWIKRVAWEPRRGSRYEPGSLFHRDGRQTSFRAARWTEGGVRLLEEQGTVLVAFDQIAELHFPLADAWQSYLGQLALLSPDASAWLVKIETADGLAATTSPPRSQFIEPTPAAEGEAPGPMPESNLLLQPAWSLDPLEVACAKVGGWTFFSPDEVPLTMLEPRRAIQRSMLGAGWPQYLVDCNVQGGSLRSGCQQSAWGYGVHAYSQLEFDLPAFARSFSVRLGLDECIGAGGCVQATVSVSGPHAATLFASPTLIGSADSLATGRLELQNKLGTGARLRLTVDPSPADRPPRADPLDIRDTFDWLEPLVQLDRGALIESLAGRYGDALWQIAGWNIVGEFGKDWRVVNQPRSPTRPRRGFRPMLEISASPLVMRRKLRLEAGRDQLEWQCDPLLAERQSCTVEVLADGRPLDELRITHDEGMSGPRRTSLAAFAGREIELTLKLSASHRPLVIDWEQLDLVAAEGPKPDNR
ncbi:MAG TPA: NPCBM/NEW2 domain-containing protein [Pirellulales bacterium]|nr:NPCBM/NEW2 domain-containing protein [Pirellulales bacterium]